MEERSLHNFFANWDKEKKERSNQAASSEGAAGRAAGSSGAAGGAAAGGEGAGTRLGQGSTATAGAADPRAATKTVKKDEDEWKGLEQKEAPGARLTTTRKTPQGPPEIYSDTQFPSLQSTAKHVESRKDKEMEKRFEVIRHKNRGRDEVSKNQALKLQLDGHYAVPENQKRSHSQYN
ncbi:hypothetical protein H8959_020352 [Pygathrix nigripes]